LPRLCLPNECTVSGCRARFRQQQCRIAIRHAVPDDAVGILAVLEVIAAERIHSAIDRVWTVEDERRYLEALSPRESIQVAVDDAQGIIGLQILDR